MSRYIDADRLRKDILGLPNCYNGFADVVEVVRCKDCKWSWYHINVDKYGKSETYWRCLNWDGETDEEGYCYEGERKYE